MLATTILLLLLATLLMGAGSFLCAVFAEQFRYSLQPAVFIGSMACVVLLVGVCFAGVL